MKNIVIYLDITGYNDDSRWWSGRRIAHEEEAAGNFNDVMQIYVHYDERVNIYTKFLLPLDHLYIILSSFT